jgi:hypothetical protein
VARKELRPAQVKLARELLTKLGVGDSAPKGGFVTTPRMLRQRNRFRRCYPNYFDTHGRWPPRWRLKNIRISGDAYFGIIELLLDITAKRTKPRQSEEEWNRAQDLKLQTVEACLIYYDEHPGASPAEVYEALGEKFGANRHTPLSRSAIRKRLGASPKDVNEEWTGKGDSPYKRRPWTLRKLISEWIAQKTNGVEEG